MSIQTDVLYGNRLYAGPTYSSNNDPESLSLSLSDTATLTETRVDSINQVLADAMSLTETIAKAVTRSLADSTTMTDSEANNATKTLSESVTTSDASIRTAIKALSESTTMSETKVTAGIKALADSSTLVESFVKVLMFARFDSVFMTDVTAIKVVKALSDAFSITDSLVKISAIKSLSDATTMTEARLFRLHSVLADSLVMLENRTINGKKGLTDFIILNEWISIVLAKANIWSTQSAQQPHTQDNTLYSVPEYNEDLYSAGPVTTWKQGTEASVVWTENVEREFALPLYSKILYAQALYGSMPAVKWADETPVVQENFTNFDGQGNVP